MALWVIDHVLTTEDRLVKEMNNDYEEALAQAWYPEVVAERPGEGRKDILEWLLTTASIEPLDRGTMKFDSLVTQSAEIEHSDFGKALKISRNDFEDDQFAFAGDWAGQIGAAMALHPQTLAEQLIANGGTAKGYDGVSFFNASHPVNPFDSSKGTYSNVFTATALTVDNFAALCGTMQSFKMPNGISRNLRVTHLLVPPALRKTAQEITGAQFISATENVLLNYNVKPVVVPALAGQDTTWYLVAQQSGQLGRPLVYSRRRAFEMTTYSGTTQAQLSVANELQWHVRGRAAGIYGHPFLMIKATA